MAFSFRLESADSRRGRCQAFLRVGRVRTELDSELFVRDAPSETRLGSTLVTSFVRGGMEKTSSGEGATTATTQLLRSLLRESEGVVARRSTRATDCENNDMFECTSVLIDVCIPYSQVCDKKQHCPFLDDEVECDSTLLGFIRQEGKSISTSLQLHGVSKHACAIYCTEHSLTFPSCDSFSFNQEQQLCNFGCSWCSDAPSIVEGRQRRLLQNQPRTRARYRRRVQFSLRFVR